MAHVFSSTLIMEGQSNLGGLTLGQNIEMVFPMAASNGTGDSGTMLGIPRFSTFIHHSAARPRGKRISVGVIKLSWCGAPRLKIIGCCFPYYLGRYSL